MRRTPLIYTAIFAALVAAMMALTSCSQTTESNKSGAGNPPAKLRVVTTFAPLYSFALNVVGDEATVENLVPIGASVHTFQAKPSDIKKIAKADVLVINGAGLETFLEDIIETAANPDLVIVDTSKSIELLDDPEHNETLEAGDFADEHGLGDPHIWLSPKNAMKQVEAIRDALVKADPKNSATYRKNAGKYIARLGALDAEIAGKLEKAEKKKYIVFHDAYTYFEQEYGLKNSATIEKFPGKEPSPKYVKDLIDLIRKEQVSIIFTEPQFSPKLVNTLKQELDIYVAELDPIGSELSKEGYEKNMRKNLDEMLKAFNWGDGR